MADYACKIWYDIDIDGYYISTGYNKNFIAALKVLIPFSDRVWDPDAKTWMFTKKYFDAVKELAKQVWNAHQIQIIDEAQVKAAHTKHQQMHASAMSPLDQEFANFMKALPYEAAQRAYRFAATLLHPDKGGNQDTMSQLNTAWTKIRKEHYNQ